MDDPVKDAKLKKAIAAEWQRYRGASEEEQERILGRIADLEADRCLTMPIEELRRLNRKEGITDEMMRESVDRMLGELRKKVPQYLWCGRR